METTVKSVEEDLKTLPKELLQKVSDYIDFLKFKYSQNSTNPELDYWQKEILDDRIRDLEENTDETLGFDSAIAELKKKYK